MLQNDKYIAFAEDHTVEVLALGSIQEGIDKKDKRADTYDAKDEAGKPVKFMKEFAGCTVEQLMALDSSPAAQYNKTGRIPYVGLVDPWTLQEIKSQPGGFAAGGLMDAVTEAQAKLAKEHGVSLKRSTLKKVDATAKDVEATLTKAGPAKALEAMQKLQASIAKEPDTLKARLKPLNDKIMDAAKAQLDDAEAKIGSGDLKGAAAIVKPLASALKGTDLEARAKELLAKATPAPTPAK